MLERYGRIFTPSHVGFTIKFVPKEFRASTECTYIIYIIYTLVIRRTLKRFKKKINSRERK